MDRASLDLTKLFRKPSDYQIDLLLNQLVHVSLASCVAVSIITVILWPVASHQWLLLWAGALLVLSIFRILLIYSYKKQEQPITDIESWRTFSLVLILLAGLVWGSIAFIYDFSWPPMQQFAVIAILVAVVIGAIPAYAAVMQVYIVSLIAILGPVIAVFLFSKHENFLIYGATLFAISVVLLILAKRYHDIVIKEVGESLQYRKDYHEMKTSHDRLNLVLEEKETEEQIARAVYTRIARLKAIEGDGIRGMVEPMGHFSGDFIYSAETPDGQTYILFADFSGHGLPAALGAIPVSSAFYSMTAKGDMPDKILNKINYDLYTQLSTAQFCCACFIVLNADKTKAQVWNGGIPDVLFIKENGQKVERIISAHIPLGIEAGGNNENSFEEVNLSKGDLIFFYTDGLIEAWSETRKSFGKKRLEELVVENYQDKQLLELIMKAVVEHCGTKNTQEDDISMLEIRS